MLDQTIFSSVFNSFAHFGAHLIYSVETPNGRTDYYYYDSITWVVGGISLIWVTWFLTKRIILKRSLIRRSRIQNKSSLKNAKAAKNRLSEMLLKSGITDAVHGIGVGKTADGLFCIQVFTDEAASSDLFRNLGVPEQLEGVPVLGFRLKRASFLGLQSQGKTGGRQPSQPQVIPVKPIRGSSMILGGVSGANTNLSGQSGTIGFFCKKKYLIPRRSDTYVLSNAHVFVDLRRSDIGDQDLIIQPSPGEKENGRPIAKLAEFSAIDIDNDTKNENRVDAAIAKLWTKESYSPVIPMIGKICGHVRNIDVEIGEAAMKFGRTTGFTAGQVFSSDLDVWIRYDRTGQSAFFKNQILIKPETDTEKFVDKGDSGSLVVDESKFALGLIFAGAQGAAPLENKKNLGKKDEPMELIDNYGIANPIEDVLSELNVELIV